MEQDNNQHGLFQRQINGLRHEEVTATPAFAPAAWRELYYVHVAPDGGEARHPAPPADRLFLTVYRLDHEGRDYEATATHNRWNAERGIKVPVRPRGEGWSWGWSLHEWDRLSGGRLPDHSALWLRPYRAERYGGGND